MRPFLVGVTGGSGSGKTYFLEQLLRNFVSGQISLLSQDNYYKVKELQPKDEHGQEDFDRPESIDEGAFVEQIFQLLDGESIKLPEYTFNNPKKRGRIITIDPAPIIIIEGIFVMYYQKVKGRLDLRLFIDAKEHIRLSRRIKRDSSERGYELDDVLYRYEKHHSPSYDKYIEPLKNEADLIIPNNHNFDKAIEVLTSFLKTKLQ